MEHRNHPRLNGFPYFDAGCVDFLPGNQQIERQNHLKGVFLRHFHESILVSRSRSAMTLGNIQHGTRGADIQFSSHPNLRTPFFQQLMKPTHTVQRYPVHVQVGELTPMLSIALSR
jgi:hypothetical protein